ncbi:MAG: SHOCT domain-containing protein [bacterium]
MHDWGMMNWGWGGMIVQLLFWIVIIVAIIWAIRHFTGPGRSDGSASGSESALDVLKKRYASGEIDKQEFEEKKRDIL